MPVPHYLFFHLYPHLPGSQSFSFLLVPFVSTYVVLLTGVVCFFRDYFTGSTSTGTRQRRKRSPGTPRSSLRHRRRSTPSLSASSSTPRSSASSRTPRCGAVKDSTNCSRYYRVKSKKLVRIGMKTTVWPFNW